MEKKDKELVGVKEIARRASVSIATVDRVLHNRTGVSQKTKDKILAIIKELDYQPNILARRLASSKTIQLYTLIPEVSKETDYWNVPLQGILQAENEIKLYNVKVIRLFYDMNDKQSFITQAGTILASDHIDGVLLAPAFLKEAENFTRALTSKKIPFVFINSDIPNQKSLSYFGPDLFHSGRTAAHLVNYLIGANDKFALLNIAKDIESDHHILRKEAGFMDYFSSFNPGRIIKQNFYDTQYPAVKKGLRTLLAKHPDISLLFVTNSRVSLVAKYLSQIEGSKIKLIGYDFLPNNVGYLNSGIIDFLVCEKPQEQAYRGIKALYRFIMFEEAQDKDYFMPIDIIHKENQQFYKN